MDSKWFDETTDYVISERVTDVFEEIYTNTAVRKALEFIEFDSDQTLSDQITLTEIPAPSFHEQVRGADYRRRLVDLGLANVQCDEAGNVFGVRKGTGGGPTLFVSAHLDTVFPQGTVIKATTRDGLVYAPGISDDGRGLTVVLGLIRALDYAQIQTKGDIIFGATVGEEGLGDLRGVKAFFKENTVDGFISVEPGDPARTTYLATGSHRYKVTYRGPGGHSFGSFGIPSAIHALGRAVAMIADVKVPSHPRTTFTVGEIIGGTSVNTIAAEASMMIDMRSNDEEELLRLEAEILDLVAKAAQEENHRWQSDGAIQVSVELVGNRPAGSQPADAGIVQASMAATQVMGFTPRLDGPSSTDSNVPISLGVPAVTLGGGGDCGGVHTLLEYFDPHGAYLGVQKVLLTILGLVGVDGTTEPLLASEN